jgi:hypothetical protein
VGDAGDDDAPEVVVVEPVDTDVDTGDDEAAVFGAVVAVCAAAGPASAISSSAMRNGWAMAPVRGYLTG